MVGVLVILAACWNSGVGVSWLDSEVSPSTFRVMSVFSGLRSIRSTSNPTSSPVRLGRVRSEARRSPVGAIGDVDSQFTRGTPSLNDDLKRLKRRSYLINDEALNFDGGH
jgi:hypothetical protein